MRLFSFFLILSLGLTLSCQQEGEMGSPNNSPGNTFNGQGAGGQEFAGGDNYSEFKENPFKNVTETPVSTFSVDADGGSYANVRRFIQQDNQRPPSGAVRTEELINYFNLDYDFSNSGHPIDLNGEVSDCPWNKDHQLIRIGIKGKPIPKQELPASNYVFLIDVSGSMSGGDRLDMLKKGFKRFVDELGSQDRIAIVTYAGASGIPLRSTKGSKKDKIKSAIDQLGAGGSTAGAEGIRTAYEIANKNFIEGGNNRVILGTDGDFNVGISDRDKLVDFIKQKRESGVFLTTLGVGRGNFNEAAMEQMANHGNGTYEYIDNLKQLKKVFVYDKNRFYTVAKDVKVQVKFHKAKVDSYRLIGYANRVLDKEDFDDDSKDAGEIGADQHVTALYQIKPKSNVNYKKTPTFTIDFRYKEPDASSSQKLDLAIYDKDKSFREASDFMQFSAAVASYSMLLTNSNYKGSTSYQKVINWLDEAQLNDPHGFKSEFRSIVNQTKGL